MNTTIRFFITSLLIIFSIGSFAQENENAKEGKYKNELRLGAGLLLEGEGGYGLFMEFSFPLIKSLEIAPSFTFATTFETEFDYYSFFKNGDFFSSQTNNKVVKRDLNYMIAALDVNIYFKPLDFINAEKVKKHQLLLGGGFGFRHFIKSFVFINQNAHTGQFELSGMNQKINGKIGVNFSAQYNFSINKRFSIGTKFLGLIFDGEGSALLALQTGIKL